jgi:hypothetical protein
MSDDMTPAEMLEKLNELIADRPHAVAQFILVQEGMRNPATVVRGRAGFLLCREYMARFVEQGGDTATATSIRANWIPAWGDDPGPPRRYDFDEIVDSGEDGGPPWKSKPIGPNLEARCEAAMIMYALDLADPAAM